MPRRVTTVSLREIARVNRVLRNEFASGILVIVAAALGFAAANTPLSGVYLAVREWRIGPSAWGLDLSLGTWAADGLLAIFFFLVGLELKREFVSGSLRKFSTAIVPVAAAFGGVALPALIYVAFTFGTPAAHGWAVPTATDIAFAVAVLGLIAPRVHPMLRVFLLTLAVVDDLIAIVIIALFYADGFTPGWLALALVPLGLYAALAHRFAGWFARHAWTAWATLLPVGVVTWVLVYMSGVHPTIAGVLLAFTIPVRARAGARARAGDGAQRDASAVSSTAPEAGEASRIDLAGRFVHRFGPISSGIAVPVFAFFAAGVTLGGASRFPFDPIAYGIIVGLVIGKPVGITLTTLLLTRFTRSSLGAEVPRRELVGVACLGGVGFTVSLLLTELSFADHAQADIARLAVMSASIVATLVAAVFLVRRHRAA